MTGPRDSALELIFGHGHPVRSSQWLADLRHAAVSTAPCNLGPGPVEDIIGYGYASVGDLLPPLAAIHPPIPATITAAPCLVCTPAQ